MVKKRKRRVFTDDFKAEVVRLVLDGGRSVPDVRREHDLGESPVYLWVRRLGLTGAMAHEVR